MINSFYNIIVVGAGIAGLSAIKKIRELNTECTVLLLTNEDRLPYKRTKINKNIAAGFKKNQFSLFDESWYIENNVELIYHKLELLNVQAKTIKLTSGSQVKYEKLLLATGASPFMPKIKGINSTDLFQMHYAQNVEQLIAFAKAKQSFLIIGGAVEGIETADELIKLRKNVTVVQRSGNPLKKLFPNEVADWYYKQVREAGVNLLTNTEVTKLHKTDDGKFQWKQGEQTLSFDGIIVCAGTCPNIAVAKKAGLAVKQGILVDEFMQTSNTDVFAAGDVAEHKGGVVTGLWHPAEYQGINAGENMLQLGKVYKPVPMRLKTEVFGHFYFSANFSKNTDFGVKSLNQSNQKVFTELYVKGEEIVGLVMMNDKENHKIYHKAVAEKLTVLEFNKLLHS